MKKVIVLVLIAIIPVFFALFGYSGGAENPPASLNLVRALTLSPWLSALLGGVIALILRHKRAIWWSMVVVFVYSYLNLGLIWGMFWSEGLFSGSLFSAASTFAAMAFIGSAFTYGMLTVIRKVITIEQQQQQQQHTNQKPRKRK